MTHRLHADAVTLRRDARTVSRNLSLAIPEGSFSVIVGPNACGKSTLLRLLSGLLDAQAGRLLLDDVSLTQIDPADRQRGIGYLPQDVALFHGSPCPSLLVDLESGPLRLGKAERTARARQVLQLVGLQEYAEQSVAQLSGGQRQRLCLARGLLSTAPLLLLDEPTASLDEANRQVVLELIGEAKAAGAALIGIFHDRAAREAVASRYLDMSQELSRQEQAHVV
ncbi:ABC transporter ATP-binding protein [Pseudomonas aeruginosa]|uniref:ABC transporter ATP-binding protein n=1 Tax=Pseudomonas aeruginosa TaxID=287 RepID=UPI001F5BC81B|nr:ABC transporter ATP-binding protein [Pseudomonas aeruginosa]UJT96797.1 ABC transporter ATP-binding protein [Pseudomonas aeruginosa]